MADHAADLRDRGHRLVRCYEAPPIEMRLTIEQIRGGRGMLGWSVERLASAAGVSAATVKRAEMPDRHAGIGDAYIDRMRRAT